MNSIINTPICIIGAGPSGAALSIFLSQKNIEHTIIDAAQFPRDKICGDGLEMKSIRALNLIDPNFIQQEMFESKNIVDCWGFKAIRQNGKSVNLLFTPKAGFEKMPPFGVSKRLVFDNLLVERINKDYLIQNCKATDIKKNEAGWQITCIYNNQPITINSKFIVGADGDHSVVLKTVGDRKINRNHYAGGVRQYWKGIADLHPKNLMEIYYPKDFPMGYLWIFPLQNGEANVGFGTLSSEASKKKINIKQEFTRILKEDKIIAPRFKNAQALSNIEGWGLPLASLKRNNAGEGWLLVGDAGSLIDPTSGEGIGTGMISSYIAAQFISRAIEQNNFSYSMFSNYNREIYNRMKDEINKFNWSMKISPQFLGWIINFALKFKFIEKVYQKKMLKWWHTAYYKKLVVKFD